MKKKALGVLAVTGTLLVQALASAGAGVAASPVVTKTVMRGEGLTSEFDRTDGCIQTRVSVFGNVSTVKGSTSQDKLAAVTIGQVNHCTATTLVDGFGLTSDFDQVITNNLSGGTLKLSMNFNNFAKPPLFR
jgi:hypothetical protein